MLFPVLVGCSLFGDSTTATPASTADEGASTPAEPVEQVAEPMEEPAAAEPMKREVMAVDTANAAPSEEEDAENGEGY